MHKSSEFVQILLNISKYLRKVTFPGVMNEDVSDDFTDPSGTVFSINMTESEIYDNFGEKCM